MNLSIVISGCGLVGAAAARALSQAGHKVRVIERVSQWLPRGAGVALPANATSQLAKLGLLKQIEPFAQQGSAISYLTASGDRLCHRAFDGLYPDDAPYLALRYQDLHEQLVAGLEDIPVAMGTEISEVRQSDSDNSVAAKLSSGEQLHCDLLLSAEGLHSPLRQTLFPGTALDDLGLFCWRFLAKKPDGFGHDPQLYLGRNDAFLIYPLSSGDVYCYGHRADQDTLHLDEAEALAQLQQCFSGYVPAVVQLTQGKMLENRLITGRMRVLNNPVWSSGRVLCIGDAAHGCGPILQQGVAQGLEDVTVLTEVLGGLTNKEQLPQALEQFRLRRDPRVRWVCEHSNTPLRLLSSEDEQLRNTRLKATGPIHTQGWEALFKSQP
ncbi:FAD-dependent oxidoreductase [Parendozoicomonas haliclonae]|uniref:FAD-dependent urate hydroxylase n=1 Tax=Parendozoicomonas haliclonae TaxID=1960125 RepID=A0A1X7AMX0_9GAMM|nr:NAD(P)/FAD-dependent oxidoreductase [Parendozoicomonas haliclonae]SMA49456.1 FAD-dependent urate hydroxylase [Parendozoicomonas haliclonae]